MTGRGTLVDSEGVFGLQRACKIAGARYLIMSLWEIPDFQTQAFITNFYDNWLSKQMTIPKAFSAAQSAMRAKFKEPQAWAGFILME